MATVLLVALALALVALSFYFAWWTYWQLVPLFLGGGQYVPTGEAIVRDMLALADLTSDDVVYDLGSGDGRLVIEAVKASGCRAVGVEIDPHLVRASERDASDAGVGDRARFVCADMWKTSVSDATVVVLFQVPRAMNRLEAKLMSELTPGTRVVSNYFSFPHWKQVREQGRVRLYVR